jgi:hypothetical protein
MRAFPQLGHRKTVVPFPESTAPQDAQRVSARITDAGRDTRYKALRPCPVSIVRVE